MRGQKDTRPNAATSERVDGAGTACETASTSICYFTTTAQLGQAIHIADYLSHGAENGVTIRHLEKLTNLDNRKIRKMIERERRAGELIVSDCKNGYYLSDDPAEAQRFARSMEHRAREIMKTAAAIREAAGLD